MPVSIASVVRVRHSRRQGVPAETFAKRLGGDWLKALGQLPLRFQFSTGIMIYQDFPLFLVVNVVGHSWIDLFHTNNS